MYCWSVPFHAIGEAIGAIRNRRGGRLKGGRLQEIEVEQEGTRMLLRTEAKGLCGKVFQAVGGALPRTVRQISYA